VSACAAELLELREQFDEGRKRLAALKVGPMQQQQQQQQLQLHYRALVQSVRRMKLKMWWLCDLHPNKYSHVC
jgi:hypothetical protein